MGTMTVAAAARPSLARQQTRRAAGFNGMRPAGVVRASPKAVFAPAVRRTAGRSAVQTKASAVEVAQVAGEVAEIAGTAGVMFVTTLVGLAVGFVLLRVESLVEE